LVFFFFTSQLVTKEYAFVSYYNFNIKGFALSVISGVPLEHNAVNHLYNIRYADETNKHISTFKSMFICIVDFISISYQLHARP
jgi:hypothetical protein